MGAEVAIIAIVGAVAGEVMSNSGNETVATIGEVSRNSSIGVLAGGAVESVAGAADAAAAGEAGATIDTGTSLAADYQIADTGTFSSSEFGASTSQLGSGVSGMTGGDASTAYAGSIAGDSATSSTVIGGATDAGAYGTAADATLLQGGGVSIGDIYNAAKQVNQGASAIRQVSQAIAPKVANNANAIGVRVPAQQFTQAAPSYQNSQAALTGAQQKAFGIADPLAPAQVSAAMPNSSWMVPIMVLAILAFTYKEMPHG